MEQIGNVMMLAMLGLGAFVVIGLVAIGAWQWWLRRGAMRGR